jgi:hypothetical protein
MTSSNKELYEMRCPNKPSNKRLKRYGHRSDIGQGVGTLHRFLARLRNEDGSASVEMVTFAIPLFIPLLLLASHTMTVASSKIEVSHLARTSLRAFVTASSTPLGHARIQQVLGIAEAQSAGASNQSAGASNQSAAQGMDSLLQNLSTPPGARFRYLIECQRLPCIQPSNRIRITIDDRVVGVQVAATLNTDRWIQGELGYRPQESTSLFGYSDIADVEEDLAPFIDGKDLLDQAREILNLVKGK